MILVNLFVLPNHILVETSQQVHKYNAHRVSLIHLEHLVPLFTHHVLVISNTMIMQLLYVLPVLTHVGVVLEV